MNTPADKSALRDPPARWRKPRIETIVCSALLITFCVIKIHSFWGLPPVTSGDAGVWTMIAKRGLDAKGFWVGPRPFTVPLLYNILDCDRPSVVRVQVAVAVLAWGVLAGFTARLFRNTVVRVTAFALILGFGLVVPNNQWDWVIRSESLSLSLFVLFLGLSLACAQLGLPRTGARLRTSILLLMALLLVAGLWLFTRDTNAYTLFSVVLTAPLAALIPSVRKRIRWRQLLIGCGVGLVLCVVSHTNMLAARRYAGPLMNVVFGRVLNVREMIDIFRDDLGMPVNDALMSRRGTRHSSDQRYAFKAPELEAFREWLYTVGPSRYQWFLLTHLDYSMAGVYRYYPTMVNDTRSYWGLGAGETAVTRAVTRALFDPWPVQHHPFFVFGAGVLGSIAVLVFGTTRRRWVACVSLLLLVNAAGQTFIAVHGDTLDILRHGFLVAVLVRLALLLLLLTAGDAVADRIRGKPETRRTNS
jgi:hypothetical protein